MSLKTVASSRLCKGERTVLSFNLPGPNNGAEEQNIFMDWIFSPFLGGIFGVRKLEALLTLFDPENLQVALMNWVSFVSYFIITPPTQQQQITIQYPNRVPTA